MTQFQAKLVLYIKAYISSFYVSVLLPNNFEFQVYKAVIVLRTKNQQRVRKLLISSIRERWQSGEDINCIHFIKWTRYHKLLSTSKTNTILIFVGDTNWNALETTLFYIIIITAIYLTTVYPNYQLTATRMM